MIGVDKWERVIKRRGGKMGGKGEGEGEGVEVVVFGDIEGEGAGAGDRGGVYEGSIVGRRVPTPSIVHR
jgi:hypothetical protein